MHPTLLCFLLYLLSVLFARVASTLPFLRNSKYACTKEMPPFPVSRATF